MARSARLSTLTDLAVLTILAVACDRPPARAGSELAGNGEQSRASAVAWGATTLQPTSPIEPMWRSARILRVCADPNNLPFSNARGEGFENKLAELVARDIGARVQYRWWPQRRGFVRSTLRVGECDVLMGIPSAFELAQPTRPYYRSTYVFLSRTSRNLHISSLDDPILRRLRIGVHLIGDDYANTPGAEALAKRGLARQVVGYSIYGDYSKPDPPAELVRAVARGEVDVAIVWGPLAGYFAQRSPEPLTLTPVRPQVDVPFLPFVFDISAGVRRGDTATRLMLDTVLTRHTADIQNLLHEFGVPLVGTSTSAR